MHVVEEPSRMDVVEVACADSNAAPGIKVIRNSLVTNGIKKSADMDVFPWVPEFRAKCSSTLGSGTSTLIELIRTFNSNVNSNASECYTDLSRAVRLKDLIKEHLLLFMHLYRYVQPQDQSREDYLEHMSDLVAVYIDMELVASQLEAEAQHGQISARLIACLCVYLDYSAEHILDTLMKVQLAYAQFSHILDPIISKLLILMSPKPRSAMMYARYFLVYRLWKKINDSLAVKKPTPLSAEALLGPVPESMPDALHRQVLLAPSTTPPAELQPLEFYLRECLDVRKACAQFLQYCRSGDPSRADSRGDITERDERLKSTNTSVPNKLSTVNTNFSKSLNSAEKSLPSSSASSSVPIVNAEIASPSCSRRATPVKSKILPKTGGIEVIDLTNDDESKQKPNGRRRPTRRRLDWLARAVQGVDAKIRAASQKRERELATTSEEHRAEDTSRRSDEGVEVHGAEKSERLEVQKLDDSSVGSREPADSKSEVNVAAGPIVEPEVEDAPRSSEKILRLKQDVRLSLASGPEPEVEDAPRSSEKILRLKQDVRLSLASVPEQLTTRSLSVERSVASSSDESQYHAEAIPRLEEEDRTDSGFIESDAPVTSNKQSEGNEPEAGSSFYDIQESDLDGLTLLACVLARQSASDNKSEKVLRLKDEERIDFAATQEHESVSTSVTEKNSISNADENQCHVEPKPRSEEKEIRVNNEVNESDVPAIRNKQPEAIESEARSNFYDIQESDLDGLTLLACVLARQNATSNKKAEIKVKPYASLQEKREPDSRVVDRIVSICPEDALDKVTLQMELSSSEMVHSRPQPELLSYVMEEPVQSSLESNDNANVILNGETVRLMQKSPNSNLYIINKAAVDNLKINYNSDEEDSGKPTEPEETKCCPQSLLIKHEPDDVGMLRGRPIKPDPDYVGQPQPHPADLHYPGHPPSGYCSYAPKIQQSSAGCACHNCVYCRQPPYYLSAQTVQTNPAVQEKKCIPTTTEAEVTKLYEDDLMKPQPHPVIEDSKVVVDKFKTVASKLPLKKRLMAQRMSMDFVNQPSQTYPGTLMMSIADVELHSGHTALELGAEVEIVTVAAKSPKSCSGKETKVKNQNMPNCFPRKSGKKKKVEEEEPCLEDCSPKKQRKPSPKQTRSSRRTMTTVKYVYPEYADYPEYPDITRRRKRKKNSR